MKMHEETEKKYELCNVLLPFIAIAKLMMIV